MRSCLGAKAFLKTPENLHLKFFNLIALEDRPANAFQAGLDVRDRKKLDITLAPGGRYERQSE